jgi:hypothetical protein
MNKSKLGFSIVGLLIIAWIVSLVAVLVQAKEEYDTVAFRNRVVFRGATGPDFKGPQNWSVDGTQWTGTVAKLNAAANLASASATAAAGYISEASGQVHRDVINFTNVVEIATDGSDEGESQELLTFPEGRILILGAAINAVCTVSSNFNASTADTFDVAIGTAACNDAADLTSTEADIIASTTLDTISSTTLALDWEADMTAGADTVFDGTASAAKLYFNMGVANANITGNMTNTVTGTLSVIWVFLGDD